MSALFISQLIGMHLSLPQQIMVVLTSVVASVGAAGIPEAGLITMTLVFNAVGLPTEFIVILVTVDWLLDRCRTMINCVGDVTVCCILDGRKAPEVEPETVEIADVRTPRKFSKRGTGGLSECGRIVALAACGFADQGLVIVNNLIREAAGGARRRIVIKNDSGESGCTHDKTLDPS